MTIDFASALVVCALIASVMLVLPAGNRVIPVIGLAAAAIEALIAFRIIQVSSARVRIDVILPAVLVVAGGFCWWRSTPRSAVTASTILAFVGLIQLVLALRVLR